MTQQQKKLLNELLQVSLRVQQLTKNINSPEELANNKYIYDDILSNVTVIYEINEKIPQQLKKTELSHINWHKIDEYRKLIQSDYHQLDLEVLYNAIKKDLPILIQKLKKVLEG